MELTPDDREKIFKFMNTQVYDYEDDDFVVAADVNGQASVNLPHVENDYERLGDRSALCRFITEEMQLRRHQHNPGFYRQLNNSSLSYRQLVHPRVLVQPVQFALPHVPRLLSILPLIQRFVSAQSLIKAG
ncbi:unnamed protein product [Didymodactylos carnosus]|nr:unnamed protein product [Didymodactylos carnosus]CAF4401210.1 unnamed protein product [Didymodactylos carnosus]